MRNLHWIVVGTLLAAIPAVDAGVVHQSRWTDVEVGAALPEDLVRPEGKTRWDLRDLELAGRPTTFSIERRDGEGAAGWVARRSAMPVLGYPARIHDPTGGDAARRWLLPHEDPDLLRRDVMTPVEIEVEGVTGTERFWIGSRRVGAGWLLLPSGPREVVLQRSLVLRLEEEPRGYRPLEIVHRWIDPRAGVVAEVRGPLGPDGTRDSVDAARVLESILVGQAGFRIYVDEFDKPARSVIRFGWDRGVSTAISSVTPDGHATIGDLAAAGSWDFSGNNLTNFPGMEEVNSLAVELSDAQSSAAQTNECGFTDDPARKLGREDRLHADGTLSVQLSVTERIGGVTSPGTVLLIASHQAEEEGGVGVDAEARTCNDPATGRTAAPLMAFANEDAGGNWYADIDDEWQSDPPFACEQIIWANAILSDRLWVETTVDAALGTLDGRNHGRVVAEGPITLPSGHTFNALVVRTWVEYGTFLGSTCPSFGSSGVRTVIHLWEVPNIGTVVRLQSDNQAPNLDLFGSVKVADIKYGLFPPLAINATASQVSDTSVELDWDPGSLTDKIDRYKIYWDTDSGADSPYTFNSDDNPGQVVFNGTTAVVSGLTQGVEYFFTVTSVSDYCEPGLCANNDCAPSCPGAPPGTCTPITCNVVTPIESTIFPLQITGGPQSVPAEVSATPGGACSPTQEIGGVTARVVGADIEVCWDPTTDDCVTGYQILGSDAPDTGFTPVVNDNGLATCSTFNSPQSYFVVVGRGADGSTGP